MAVTNGAAPNILSLIDAIRVFAVANGWTQNHYGDIGAGKRLHLSRGSVFINLRACVNENPGNDAPNPPYELPGSGYGYGLWANISTGFDSSATRWYKQTGAPYRIEGGTQEYFEMCGMMNFTGGLNYWLFAFDNTFYIVVESPAGQFHWMGWGNLSPKFGDWGGGEFLFAKHSVQSNPYDKNFPLFGSSFGGQGSGMSFLRMNNFDGNSGWARGYGLGSVSGNIRGERIFDSSSRQRTLWEVAPNMISGKPVPLPFSIWVTRNGVNVEQHQPISYLGGLEKIYFINFSGLLPGQLYPDGSGAIYRIFPFHQKVDETNLLYPNYTTGTLGFAIKTN